MGAKASSCTRCCASIRLCGTKAPRGDTDGEANKEEAPPAVQESVVQLDAPAQSADGAACSEDMQSMELSAVTVSVAEELPPLQFVVGWGSSSVHVEVGGTATVAELKAAIEQLTEVPVARQKLLGLQPSNPPDSAMLTSLRLPRSGRLTLVGSRQQVVENMEAARRAAEAEAVAAEAASAEVALANSPASHENQSQHTPIGVPSEGANDTDASPSRDIPGHEPASMPNDEIHTRDVSAPWDAATIALAVSLMEADTGARVGSLNQPGTSAAAAAGLAEMADRDAPESPRSLGDSNGEKCIVCEDRTVDACLVPCAHVILCMRCASQLNPRKCPLCRLSIEQIVKTSAPKCAGNLQR
eukprot:gnl/TRDRNA2_/TRDRNA2_171019_c3_seq1.p1 gnl/TRDRNA2_/TRDRNA2_171019_c3~~gnl/TRDRNA2_/TRDRNA2_171019_c3_seq1.p1  ORF type:complete len:357 (-),score=55.92 gnl/TRDRNA2_/TRDRNA2_171019_c3_seq1:173-1243(-)